MLFLFNVFVPMYLSDGAKILTRSLALGCGLQPETVAKVQIATTVVAVALLLFAANPIVIFLALSSGMELYRNVRAVEGRQDTRAPQFRSLAGLPDDVGSGVCCSGETRCCCCSAGCSQGCQASPHPMLERSRGSRHRCRAQAAQFLWYNSERNRATSGCCIGGKIECATIGCARCR